VLLCVESVAVTTCSTLPKPVAVPLLVIVAPLGMVMVSPLAPKVREVPDCGSIVSTSIVVGNVNVAPLASIVAPLGILIVSPDAPMVIVSAFSLIMLLPL
jgi:hypothetical protein